MSKDVLPRGIQPPAFDRGVPALARLAAGGGESGRKELGAFLRSRRGRVSALEAGLQPGQARRRVPGLRREEVAALAGVGVTWYTWLEQGRAITVSARALRGIARALRLTDEETRYVFRLAQAEVTASSSNGPSGQQCPPDLQFIVASYPGPAIVRDLLWNVACSNRAAAEVLGLDGLGDRNMLRRAFLDATFRRSLVNWSDEMRGLVARFRAECAERLLRDPEVAELVRDLTALSPDFARLWADRNVERAERGVKVIRQPSGRVVRLTYTTFEPVDAPELRLVIYGPA